MGTEALTTDFFSMTTKAVLIIRNIKIQFAAYSCLMGDAHETI